jgi:hypothetical protein
MNMQELEEEVRGYALLTAKFDGDRNILATVKDGQGQVHKAWYGARSACPAAIYRLAVETEEGKAP